MQSSTVKSANHHSLPPSLHPSFPQVFFANERTFLAWLNMAVTLSSISIAILAFADHNEFSQIYGFIILPVAICFCVYALRTYVKR